MRDIKGTITKLIKRYKTSDPFKIAEKSNIILSYEELGKTLGYYTSHKRIKSIHLNNCIDESLQKFVCAHELGHAILHPTANTPFLRRSTFFSIDKIEVEANTFAVELLIQDDYLRDYKDTNLSIYEISNIYGVPKELMHLKIF